MIRVIQQPFGGLRQSDQIGFQKLYVRLVELARRRNETHRPVQKSFCA
jgi:hypothetical protein